MATPNETTIETPKANGKVQAPSAAQAEAQTVASQALTVAKEAAAQDQVWAEARMALALPPERLQRAAERAWRSVFGQVLRSEAEARGLIKPSK